MASNHTTHFGLNQWAATDPVLREDFNADNQKIEEALSVPPFYEKLMEIISSENSGQIEVDLSDIDPDKFQRLDFVMDLFAANDAAYNETDLMLFAVSINSTTDTANENSYSFSTRGNTQMFGYGYLPRRMADLPSRGVLHMNIAMPGTDGRRVLGGIFEGIAYDSRNAQYHQWYQLSSASKSSLEKLILYSYNAAIPSVLAAGTQITVYGMRR